MKKVIKLTESQVRDIVSKVILETKQKPIRENFWRSIFGEPDIQDAANSALKQQGASARGKDMFDEERPGENYIMYNGMKFYPDQIEYADYQDMGDLPRIENDILIVPNPAWKL